MAECNISDWDWNPREAATETREDLKMNDILYDYPILWLCYNAIVAKFHQQNSLAHQLERLNDMSPWPNGQVRPPLAFEWDIRNNVAHNTGDYKYQMHIGPM